MINLIGLCKSLKEKFPDPAHPKKIYDSIVEFVGSKPDFETQKDITRVLSKSWRRRGWTWNMAGAVKLEAGEEVLFHNNGLTIIFSDKSMPSGMVGYRPVFFGEAHPKVVWFS